MYMGFVYAVRNQDDEMRRLYAVIVIIFLCSKIKPISGIVYLKSSRTSFTGTPAIFGASINRSGICGALVVADPLDACSSLHNTAFQFEYLKFALIVRGNCSFLEKIQNAQLGGFHGAIVFDDQVQRNLISMIGSSEGIWIPAIFVSNEVGETLMKNAQGVDGECCMLPSLKETSWTVLIISFISILLIVSVLTAFVVARVYWRDWNRSSILLGEKLVELLPCAVYSTTHISGYMVKTCAICLQDYKQGDSLKVLPCKHKFHADCVGSWLTRYNTICPLCKYDLKTEITQEVSERRCWLVF